MLGACINQKSLVWREADGVKFFQNDQKKVVYSGGTNGLTVHDNVLFLSSNDWVLNLNTGIKSSLGIPKGILNSLMESTPWSLQSTKEGIFWWQRPSTLVVFAPNLELMYTICPLIDPHEVPVAMAIRHPNLALLSTSKTHPHTAVILFDMIKRRQSHKFIFQTHNSRLLSPQDVTSCLCIDLYGQTSCLAIGGATQDSNSSSPTPYVSLNYLGKSLEQKNVRLFPSLAHGIFHIKFLESFDSKQVYFAADYSKNIILVHVVENQQIIVHSAVAHSSKITQIFQSEDQLYSCSLDGTIYKLKILPSLDYN